MGLENSNHATYLTIGNGKICKQVKFPTEASISRINKNGKEVHEEFYDKISGMITSIDTKENEYGKFWNIGINDEGDSYILQLNYSGGYAGAFLKTLPNVDLTQKVVLIPKVTIDGEKKKTTLFINQSGKSLKHYYTKDNPNGLPGLEQKKIKGKLSWDDSAMMEFLEEMVRTQIRPQLNVTSRADSNEDLNDTLL
jgi:hypothetical protein